ncbi:conserved Plasmodium protein, unknown function [Plasmodium knowlesi strain H]|uniref:Uncharacterized protein n=3 Tax=Plasmodium knowlesi TaxID=5850 RepID=A0A5K1VUL0_PLAKH|nr:conserved Plasmodium protein, unknown function [Plasmodium knowlesi strain H]OTN64538.1 Uncharacterized protein PKNOH_S130198900 [Plasmodium knowlesi]CAA9989149.1 conserved Plasmodium protein, unknown function [Plasmodium knowlesi strain H]SBO27367.1 conserved Plasmodium protein, unknown function [Plasmodium knowlesi strain H]SBO27520.1 conserved Plasmodium protein, unknown function [Plasmodium knowlesi strain H]VVS78623.1 conserved Plasmodium protein, unknown function [Plasmodium knowlesi |eukprot:XP_002261496.1 hypothetical protein, conserved in Plasmodium species [Plasmodium knowlesi strain H]
METESNGKTPIGEMNSSTENLANQISMSNLTSIDNIKTQKINMDENNYNYFNYAENETPLVKNEHEQFNNISAEIHGKTIFSERNLKHDYINNFQMNLPNHEKDDAENSYTDTEVQMRNQQNILKILEDDDVQVEFEGAPGMGTSIEGQHLSEEMGVCTGENPLENTADAENGGNDSILTDGEDTKGELLKEADLNENPLSVRTNLHQVPSNHEEHLEKEDHGGEITGVATTAGGENLFGEPNKGDDNAMNHSHTFKEKAEINIIHNKDLIKAKKSKDKSTEKYKNKYKNKFLHLFRKKNCSNKIKDQHMFTNEAVCVMEKEEEKCGTSSTDGSSGRQYVQENLSPSFNLYNRNDWKGEVQERCKEGKGVNSEIHIPIQIVTGEIQLYGEKENMMATVRESHTCSIKTEDNLMMDMQNENMAGADLERHTGNIGTTEGIATYASGDRHAQGREQKLSFEWIDRKNYSLEKIKSFMSNNTFLKDKKYFLQKKKTQLSKEVNFFCHHYNVLLCFFLYIVCFAFVMASICYDSWKVHQMELKSENIEKVVHIDIGATTIRRVQKVSKQNGDVTLSIDKEQTMDSLIENEICRTVTKDELEDFLTFLASNNKLKYEQNLIDPTKGKVSDGFLLDALKNPAHVGLLKDEKLVLTRKHIFGPTIYNLECKFLEKIKKAGTYHKILLYAILFFLLIPIFLLFHILLNYKKEKNVQLVKYISFVFVNLALITMISSLFSVNRAYNIPLCVMHDGSSDICQDGSSIHFIRSSIILLIFSNLFFCKFVHVVRKKNSTLSGSLV